MNFIENNFQRNARQLTLARDNNLYEIIRLSDGNVAFSGRRPRKDSKYWNDAKYLIWNLERNEKA